MRGGRAGGIRAYNERLVIAAILEARTLSKAGLARRTGLSANAAMIIANRLIEAGVLRKCPPVQGQMGQPSIPIAVNPAGAFSLGVHIGRRCVQSVLIDFAGSVVGWREIPHDFPDPGTAVDTALRQCRRLLAELDPGEIDRVAGLGIAMPDALQTWARELDLPPGALDGWRDKDVQGILAKSTGLQTTLYNDASAACAAELVCGDAITRPSALYMFFGTFIGGGVVIGGRLYQGARLNAGAIGAMPAGSGTAGDKAAADKGAADKGAAQLIHRASLIQLEAMMVAAGVDPEPAFAGKGGEPAHEVFRTWLDEAVPAVAHAIVSALSVIDFEIIVIDGNFSPAWRRELTHRIRGALAQQNLSGLLQPVIATGSVGATAPVLGAAMMPLREKFAPDPKLVVARDTGRHPGADRP